MFRLEGGRPGDARGFVHKKLLRVGTSLVKRFIPPVAIASDIFSTGRSLFAPKRAARPVLPRTTTARPSIAGEQGKELGRGLKFGGPESVQTFGPQNIRLPVGGGGGGHETADARCSRLRRGSIADQAEWQRTCGVATAVGEAVMGQYGAALQPGSQMIDRAICLRGMQLGNDGLCYNKGQITNKQRMWPAGRKPLLTGGDMGAISTAARAGRRLELATKRLQKMGMMRKPARRGVPAGHRARLVHNSEH